jgi:protein subunit release factor A
MNLKLIESLTKSLIIRNSEEISNHIAQQITLNNSILEGPEKIASTLKNILDNKMTELKKVKNKIQKTQNKIIKLSKDTSDEESIKKELKKFEKLKKEFSDINIVIKIAIQLLKEVTELITTSQAEVEKSLKSIQKNIRYLNSELEKFTI